MRITLVLILAVPGWSDSVFGRWRVRANGSPDGYSGIVLIRIEPHPKGEVFTVDRVDRDGRVTTDSTILYLDGRSRHYQGAVCSGTQSSRLLDNQTVEIMRNCDTGAWTKFLRRSSVPAQMAFEITGRHADGRKFECRLVLQKQ